MPYGIFDGILVGTKHTNQTKGGSWKTNGGTPNVSVNGNIWMKAITYSSVADTKSTYQARNSSYIWNRIGEITQEIATKSYSEAYTIIVNSGIAGTTATALLRSLGKVNAIFTSLTVMNFIRDFFVLNRYSSAVSNGDGMLKAQYQTSYQGSWYSHLVEDTWTSANTVYEPASYYGTGYYTSN